jgi:DNA-binding transcriptional LysR family regulator
LPGTVDLRHLRYFVAVAEELHFTRAAQRLHIAQSALSAQIGALEREVGAQLLVRTSRRVALSPVGEALLVDARRVLADADAALGRARALARAQQQHLIVGCLGPASAASLGPLIARFGREHPEATVDVQAFDFGEILGVLRDARADVAFTYLPYDTDERAELVVVELDPEPRVVALAESHPLAARAELRPADLAGETFVTRAGVPDPWLDFWALSEPLGGRPPLCPQVAEGREAWLYLVASGQGIDTAPLFVARHYRWPGIAYVPLVDVPPARRAVVRLRSQRSALPAAFVAAARVAN